MIETRIRVHDKFSVEFKIGFLTSQKEKDINNFKINTWIFVSNGLDINRYTYKKEHFYSDIKSNVRLITPVYTLKEILTEGKGPFPRLEQAICNYVGEQSHKYAENYTYQIKMLLCIMKSVLRDHSLLIKREKREDHLRELLADFIKNITAINNKYRIIRDEVIYSKVFLTELKEYISFGDEYLSFLTEESVFDIIKTIKGKPVYEEFKPKLIEILKKETANNQKMNYSVPSEKEGEHNSLILIKRSLLKKFVESDLFLQRIKKADGSVARELYYSVAAGLAMIFATIISFAATQQFGNFTLALFLALVVSYMFKDRIKDMARYYFSSRLDQKYFDWKWDVSIRNEKIGWIKEAFDFIPANKIPYEILSLRNKSPLVKAENKVYDEQVILYRKRVNLSKKDLEKYKEYHLSGINDIIRLNLISFIKKMDNPVIPIHLLDEKDGYKVIEGKRVYAIYFILECSSDEEKYYKKYRLLFNRNGISDVLEID